MCTCIILLYRMLTNYMYLSTTCILTLKGEHLKDMLEANLHCIITKCSYYILWYWNIYDSDEPTIHLFIYSTMCIAKHSSVPLHLAF